MKNKTILGIVWFIVSVLIMINLHGCSCKNQKEYKADKAGIDWNEIEEKFQTHHYSTILEQVYFPYFQAKTDTFLAPFYVALSAARIARIYHTLFQFEQELGRELYRLFIKNKNLTSSKNYSYFYSFYFYLNDSTKQAINALHRFINTSINHNHKDWAADAKLLAGFYRNGFWAKAKARLPFNNILFNTLLAYHDKSPTFPLHLSVNPQLWEMTSSLFTADSTETLKLFSRLVNLKNSPAISREELGRVNISADSVFIFYQKYYNPLLLASMRHFYTKMALNAYRHFERLEHIPDGMLDNVTLEMAVLLEEQGRYEDALNLLQKIRTQKNNPLLNGFVKILSFSCKNQLSPLKIDIPRRLDALNEPILQSFFLYKISQLGLSCEDELLTRYFKFNRFDRTQQLTCSEYLGHYFLQIQQYDKAQSYYQRRLLGGSFDLEKNAPLYLIQFAKAYYHNKLNRDQGLWILRKISRIYPAIKQVEQLYASIIAEKIFK